MTNIYTTKEIATAVGIHVNTVRFYEEIGFLTKPARFSNGYRCYTDLQLGQCRLIRCAMRAEVLQNGLRDKAVEVVRLCAKQDYDSSLSAAIEYRFMIQEEIRRAGAAIASVEETLGTVEPNEDIVSVCDRLIISLQNALSDADMLISMLKDMKNNFSTIQ